MSGSAARSSTQGKSTLLFDGVCNLCNGWVDFVIRRDPQGHIRFAALQSPAGRQVLEQRDMPADYLESLVLVDSDGRVHANSSAVLGTLRLLRWPWPLFYTLKVIPAPIRDFVYRRVAKRRYRWFGKRDTCRTPTPDERERFL